MCVCILLFERLHNRGVGYMYLLIAGASGGVFLPGIRRIQISPQRCQRARDGETSKLLAHNLKEGKEKLSILFANSFAQGSVCLVSGSLWRCVAWAVSCSQPEWAPDHPGRGGWRKWHHQHCSHRSHPVEESSDSHPTSSGPSVNPSPDLHKETLFKNIFLFCIDVFPIERGIVQF